MERNINNLHNREKGVFNGSGDSNNTNNNNNLVRATTHPPDTRSALATTSSDFVLQWGNRKRLRCMKVQGKDRHATSSGAVRADRRVVRSDLNGSKEDTLNLRQRPASPSPAQRILRNSEIAMKGGHSNGVGAQDKRGTTSAHNSTITPNHHHNHTNNNHHQNNNNNNINNGGVGSGSGSDVAHDSKKGGNGAGTSSGSDAMPTVWPPKFVIALTNKEKEEDFYAFKGSKLPQRPKKRSKFIQRTLNMVSPGTWLSDLTLERYEVREKKTSKKRPRGLKAMGNMESESE